MIESPVAALLQRPVAQIGYVVAEIEPAIERWSQLGIGPFFVFEHPVFDRATHGGDECVFDHSAALASWGDRFIELQELHTVEPQQVATGFGRGREDSINHIAFVSDTPESDSAALEAAGIPEFVHLQIGGMENWLHFAPHLGHAIEIHRDTSELTTVLATIAAAADDWDGSTPLRKL